MSPSLPQLELVSHHLCPYVQRAVITLLEKRIPHTRTYIDLSDKPDWFLKLSPLGKVPLLKVDGEAIFESAVICEYLNEITLESLHPDDPLERAKHRAWNEFGSSILNTIAGFYNAPTQKQFEHKQQEILNKFAWIEHNGMSQPYFAGENFTLVDAVYGPIFRYFDVFERVVSIDFFADTPHLNRWRQALQNYPHVKNAVVEDYPQRLLTFLQGRNSYLSHLISSH